MSDVPSTKAVLTEVPTFLSALDRIEQLLHEHLELNHLVSEHNMDLVEELFPHHYRDRFRFPDDAFRHLDATAFKRLRKLDRRLAERIDRFVKSLSEIEPVLERVRVTAHLLGIAAAQRAIDPTPVHTLLSRWYRTDLPAAQVIVETLRSRALAELSGQDQSRVSGGADSVGLRPDRKPDRLKDGGDLESVLAAVPTHVRKAYLAFEHARRETGDDRITDSDAHAFLLASTWPAQHGYDLPSPESFTRYLSAVRKALKSWKHEPRAGRTRRNFGTPDQLR